MRQLDTGGVARRRIAVEHEDRPRLEHRPPAVEPAHAQLRPLQVGQDRARPPELLLQPADRLDHGDLRLRSEEHTSELQSLMRISYAVFCLKKKKYTYKTIIDNNTS